MKQEGEPVFVFDQNPKVIAVREQVDERSFPFSIFYGPIVERSVFRAAPRQWWAIASWT